jgi:hypothetical protein
MQINWTPGIGDPSLLGWLTVVAYFVVSITCVACARKIGKENSLENAAGHRCLWWFCATVLLLLGINKQLDLQTLITEVGKVAAKHQGWYEQRKSVQAVFIAGVACGGLLSLIFLWRTFRTIWNDNWLTLFGLIVLVCFILIRATSFHGIDSMLGLELSGLSLNWILEFGAITCIWVSAVLTLKKTAREKVPIETGKRANFI